MSKPKNSTNEAPETASSVPETSLEAIEQPPKDKEYGGRTGPEPTRYGDWENNGIISDF